MKHNTTNHTLLDSCFPTTSQIVCLPGLLVHETTGLTLIYISLITLKVALASASFYYNLICCLKIYKYILIEKTNSNSSTEDKAEVPPALLPHGSTTYCFAPPRAACLDVIL